MQYLRSTGAFLFKWYYPQNEAKKVAQVSESPLLKLPKELILEILSYCNHETLLKVAKCSKKLCNLSYDNSHWARYSCTYKITQLDETVNLRMQIQSRYIYLKRFLIAADSYEKANYTGMCETLTQIIQPKGIDPEDRKADSSIKYSILLQQIYSSKSFEEFRDKTEVLLLFPSQHQRFCNQLNIFFSRFCTLMEAKHMSDSKEQLLQKTAQLIHVLLRFKIDFNHDLLFKYFSPHFLRPLIETFHWKPTKKMFDAILELFAKVSVPEYLLLFREHGFIPSFEHLKKAVCNYSIEKFKFLLSLNSELKTDRELLKVAVQNNNLEVTAYLLETMRPNLDLLKTSLKISLLPSTATINTQILILILQKGLDPHECACFLNEPLTHIFGRGVLNEYVEKCDIGSFEELLKDVDPELLTLQIALKKSILEKRSEAYKIIKLLIFKAKENKMRGGKEALKWLDFNDNDYGSCCPIFQK